MLMFGACVSVHCVQRIAVFDSLRRFSIQDEYYRRSGAVHHPPQPGPAGTLLGDPLPFAIPKRHSLWCMLLAPA